MDRLKMFVLFFLLAPGLFGAFAAAQVNGSISGTIRDESGAVLPGATVTLGGPALQTAATAVASDSQGRYRFLMVPAGRYELSVKMPGFARERRTDIRLAVNQELNLDFTLRLAEIIQTVEVTSSPAMIEANRADINSRVTPRTIDRLPLNGRNFEDLIGLVPGAKPDPAGDKASNISIFGERGAAISYIVDGQDNNDPLNGGAFQRYTQDSIQEFEVITTGYEAEFGRAQGGVVNVITKSGTNSFSGSGFGFFRNDALDSSNVAGQNVPQLSRKQWGATLGGPLYRNKAFFFGSVELLDETRGINIDRSRIPDFVTAGEATPSGLEDFQVGPGTDGLTGMFRFDYNPGNHHLYALFNRSRRDVSGEISSPVAGTVALPSAARTETDRSNSFGLRDSWEMSATRFLESSAKVIDGRAGSNLGRDVRLEPILLLFRSGFVQTGAPFGGKNRRDTTTLQLAQNLSSIVSDWGGQHQFKMGWEWIRTALTGFNDITNDVEYSAAFLAPDQASIMQKQFQRLGFQQAAARFFTLSGNPDGSLDLDILNNNLGLFFQDEWKVHPRLTLNLGIRYDYSSLFGADRNNLAPRLGFAWDLGGNHATVVRAGFGLFYDRNLLSAASTVPELGGVFTRSAFDVALPRLGSNYTDSLIDLVITSGFPLPGGGRSPAENPAYKSLAEALRANPLALYALLGIEVPDPSLPPVVTADNIQQLSGLSPDQAIGLLESSFPGTDWEFFDVPGGSIVGNRVLSFFPRGPLGLTRDVSRFSSARTPWTRAFNIGIEQQIGNDMVLSVNYVHRRSRDLLTRRIINLFDVAPGSPNFGKTTDGGPRINAVTYDGRVDYDGLILELRRRFTSWYSFDLSYTASRARDNLLTGQVGSGFSNNNHPELDYGPSNLSAPQVLVVSSLLDLPWNLHLSAITFWRSGNAFNPRGITDQDGDGLVDQRDISVPRNHFRTDPFFDLDLRVEKRLRLGENNRLGILFEAFNLSNRANVKNVNSVSGPSFGIPNNFFPGREIQLGLKFHFGP